MIHYVIFFAAAAAVVISNGGFSSAAKVATTKSACISLLLFVIFLSTPITIPIVAPRPATFGFSNCLQHFYKSTPPTPRENCTAATCVELCHGDPGAFFYATYHNKNLRAPEFSAQYLEYDNTWIASVNDFARPSWQLTTGLTDLEQYPLDNILWDGTGPFDKGHLLSKENFDFSKAASDSTFTICNVVPQLDGCNRGQWLNGPEKNVRQWVMNHNISVYVVVHIGYKDYAKPNYTEGIVVPDYMIYFVCDPQSKQSLALVAVSNQDSCGGTIYQYRAVRQVEKMYLNGTKVFHDDCNPCQLNNSHWFNSFASTTYADGVSVPELCATTLTSFSTTTSTSTSSSGSTSTTTSTTSTSTSTSTSTTSTSTSTSTTSSSSSSSPSSTTPSPQTTTTSSSSLSILAQLAQNEKTVQLFGREFSATETGMIGLGFGVVAIIVVGIIAAVIYKKRMMSSSSASNSQMGNAPDTNQVQNQQQVVHDDQGGMYYKDGGYDCYWDSVNQQGYWFEEQSGNWVPFETD